MRKKFCSLVLLLCLWIAVLPVFGQDSTSKKKVEMADVFRSNGKIYVVVAVSLFILLGLIVYVFSLDRKITRMEKELK